MKRILFGGVLFTIGVTILSKINEVIELCFEFILDKLSLKVVKVQKQLEEYEYSSDNSSSAIGFEIPSEEDYNEDWTRYQILWY